MDNIEALSLGVSSTPLDVDADEAVAPEDVVIGCK
jgi:hypothetical protein